MLAIPFVILALVIIGIIWFVVYKLRQKKIKIEPMFLRV